MPAMFPLLSIKEHVTLMAHAYGVKSFEERS